MVPSRQGRPSALIAPSAGTVGPMAPLSRYGLDVHTNTLQNFPLDQNTKVFYCVLQGEDSTRVKSVPFTEENGNPLQLGSLD